MVASDTVLSRLISLFSRYGFNVSVKKISEEDLYGAKQDFKLLHAVTNGLDTVFTVRIRDDGWVRIHFSIRRKNKSYLENIADNLESMGYKVSVDDDYLSATLYTSLKEINTVTTKTIEAIGL